MNQIQWMAENVKHVAINEWLCQLVVKKKDGNKTIEKFYTAYFAIPPNGAEPKNWFPDCKEAALLNCLWQAQEDEHFRSEQ